MAGDAVAGDFGGDTVDGLMIVFLLMQYFLVGFYFVFLCFICFLFMLAQAEANEQLTMQQYFVCIYSYGVRC